MLTRDLEISQECEELAEALQELNSKENQGRGLGFIRTICVYVRRVDLVAARALAIRNLEEISQCPRLVLFFKIRFNEILLAAGLDPIFTCTHELSEEG